MLWLTAVSYPNYKKTPPPVPPRTTSKPLISVTAQSSTESTQDAYHDSRTQRISPWPHDGRGHYNSTDSLDSNKAMNLALESAAVQRHASESKSSSVRSTSDKAVLVTRSDEFLKKRRSSIGIQVWLHLYILLYKFACGFPQWITVQGKWIRSYKISSTCCGRFPNRKLSMLQILRVYSH